MPTLRQKMKNEMTLRGFCLGTQESYLRAVIKLHDHFNRNPAKLNTEEIKSFLLTLANQPIAASTYNINIHGLKFFYEVVLDKPMVAIKLPRKREPQKLPDILSAIEVERIIKATTNPMYRTLFILIYGAGLRASEASTNTLGHDKKRLDAQIGMTAFLHTWNQKLSQHNHLHCMVPAGGLSYVDGQMLWNESKKPDYLFPVKVMGKLFGKLFLTELTKAFKNNAFQFQGCITELAKEPNFRKRKTRRVTGAGYPAPVP